MLALKGAARPPVPPEGLIMVAADVLEKHELTILELRQQV